MTVSGTESIDTTPPAAREAAFPIVAIGASAGGLDALRRLFSSLPDDTGMAFVVIQHLDPARPSMLASVLAANVGMPVVEVTDGMRAEPNRVHVIPPASDLGIQRGVLALVPRGQTGKLHLPIDSFFRALAADASSRAIGVVLSGSASDGTEGLGAIKAEGGITFVQEPESAQFRSMPESAIAAGFVDRRAGPEEIASELVRLSRHPYLAVGEGDEEKAGEPDSDDDEGAFASLLGAVRRHTQLDFSGYKRPTLMRRIGRRMALRRVGSLAEYADSLRDDAQEAKALAEDMLIHVTSFFRDPAAFEALEHHVLPELLAHKHDDANFRVWVPGCSTGEEAYSLAICLVEFLTERNRHPSITIFGSDLGERVIETARAGVYTEAQLQGVSPERIERFFERFEGSYRIGKQIRDLCVFVRHDLTRDPPFAKLDLLSCRNVLIYFDADLQHRILPLLHHCLNDPGYLFLGNSEGIRELGDIFVPIDREHRIFRRTGQSRNILYPRALGREAETKLPVFKPTHRPAPARDAQRQADHILLARYAPPGVLINERLEVVQFRGRTGEFLEPAPGQPQMNVLKMARDGLGGPMREAIEAALSQSIPIRSRGIRLTGDGPTRWVDLEVVPLARAPNATARYLLVVFEDEAAPGRTAARPPRVPPAAPGLEDLGGPSEVVTHLKAELAATTDYLQAISGEHQDATEELGAANEELIAANEELQSTNEELQSAKEELQSTNEELSTLNDELHHRNEELDVVANDLVNVLESVQIPVILVDEALCVRRFTPISGEVSSLLPGDVGRPLDDVKLKVRIDDLVDRVRETIESLTPTESEVQGVDGRWFRLHIRPYRMTDQSVGGAVLSFLDVDVLKRAAEEAERARDYAQRIVETVPMSLVVLDRRFHVVSANPPFYRSFDTRPNLAAHADLFELAAGALDVAPLREAIERSLSSHAPFSDLALQCPFPGARKRDFLVAGCPIYGPTGDALLLLAIEDRTERLLLEASEKEARVEAERANRAKDLFLATLSHELRTPLNTILMSAQLLQMSAGDDPKVLRASTAIERAVGNQARLIDDLLDVSRIVSGKLMLDLQAVDLTTVVASAVDVAQSSAQARGIRIELDIGGPVPPVHGDPSRLQQVVTNLLNNSIKFTAVGGSIEVSLVTIDGKAAIRVTDNGLGFDPALGTQLFDRFVQAEGSMTRAHGGLGLGLAIVRHLVEVHGGDVRGQSDGRGQGATFTVTLPLAARNPSVPPAHRSVTRSISDIRVLLVEDDDDTREVCAAMLEGQGAEVLATSSTADALAALDEFTPQVILCDIAMPGEDGYAFIRKLRGGTRSATTPAAALTALAGEEHRTRALESGFQMHLAKPVDADRLATAVATLASWPKDGAAAARTG